ncbi:hypothetical protein Ddye_003877 [Dipteronia dyeriana]|uniref:DUF382 domain-containing protein n=1 Tax=Dipteronia dyeriana TaxID=168575 RepID=A0AAD9XUG7_9ROSI|nr:hypothetical protein Ddye_003877 [Dipteronia dyeriana]
MMIMKGVLAVMLLMMVSSVSASGNGFSSCTCSYVDGKVVTGTIVTSPDGSGSICTCPVSQQPPQTPIQNPPSAPVARNLPQPQHPAFQLPPIPFMDPRAQSCLQEFLDSNACMTQTSSVLICSSTPCINLRSAPTTTRRQPKPQLCSSVSICSTSDLLIRFAQPKAKASLPQRSICSSSPRPIYLNESKVYDAIAADPKLLVFLKAYRNIVHVPRHWCHKRKFLQSSGCDNHGTWTCMCFAKRTVE